MNERREKRPLVLAPSDAFKQPSRTVFEKDAEEDSEEEPMFVIDRKGAGARRGTDDGEAESSKGKGKHQNDDEPSVRAAWVDSDDEDERIDIANKAMLRKLRVKQDEKIVDGATLVKRLRDKHSAIHGKHSWAELPAAGVGAEGRDPDEERDEDAVAADAVLKRSGGTFTKGSVEGGPLPPTKLNVARVRDANFQDVGECAVNSVEFHRNGQLLLTAGLDKRIRLFQIDGKFNPRVQSVYIPDLPITQAAFTPDGTSVLCAGNRKFFYTYDIAAGKVDKTPWITGRADKSLDKFALSPDGQLTAFAGDGGSTLLVSSQTKQWCGTVQMSQPTVALSFTADSRHLLTAGRDGDVYVWDIRMSNRCVNKFTDDGSVHATALTCSPASASVFASASDTGVVNLCRLSDKAGQKPALDRALMSLTTPVQTVRFSNDGDILATASKDIKGALRLVHVPTRTVFANWPTANTPLQYVTSVCFSPNSGYFAAGNDKGKVVLYRLLHYTKA